MLFGLPQEKDPTDIVPKPLNIPVPQRWDHSYPDYPNKFTDNRQRLTEIQRADMRGLPAEDLEESARWAEGVSKEGAQ